MLKLSVIEIILYKADLVYIGLQMINVCVCDRSKGNGLKSEVHQTTTITPTKDTNINNKYCRKASQFSIQTSGGNHVNGIELLKKIVGVERALYKGL